MPKRKDAADSQRQIGPVFVKLKAQIRVQGNFKPILRDLELDLELS